MGIYIKPDSEKEGSQLQDNAVLIINGLSQSGRVLAEMLAKQGADVAIVDSQPDQELAHTIECDVSANGRRCLVLLPGSQAAGTGPFPQYAVQKIVETFGRLDAFISYSAADSSQADETMSDHGRSPKSLLFDQAGLTKAVLKHIISQNQA
jgi:NAD(P)-dependent dehydrogenase (short-subunit alcohol dehydrogenase family)